MDKSVVSDLLVSVEEAKKEIERRISALELCSSSEHVLSKWYDDTIEALDGLFVSEATAYFSNNSGFDFSYSWDGTPRKLSSANTKRAKGILKRMLEALGDNPKVTSADSKEKRIGKTELQKNKKVFVVHGHDESIREKVECLLEKLDLEPVVINKKANQGLTILEKIEKHSDVGFAVVLFTSDDLGASKKEHSNKLYEERPRQNVLLELGYFWGMLGRGRVCLLNAIGDNLSSDLKGLGYTSIDGADAWRFELLKELSAAGYTVDANKIL